MQPIVSQNEHHTMAVSSDLYFGGIAAYVFVDLAPITGRESNVYLQTSVTAIF